MRNCPWHIVDSSRHHYHHYQTLPSNTQTEAAAGRFMEKGEFINFLFLFARYSFEIVLQMDGTFCSTGGSECRTAGVVCTCTLLHCKVLRTYKHIRYYIVIIMMTIFFSSALVAMTAAAAAISLPYFSRFFHFAVTFWLTVDVSGRRWR